MLQGRRVTLSTSGKTAGGFNLIGYVWVATQVKKFKARRKMRKKTVSVANSTTKTPLHDVIFGMPSTDICNMVEDIF